MPLDFFGGKGIMITIETCFPSASREYARQAKSRRLIHGYFGLCGIFLLKSSATGAKAESRAFTHR